jgi:hypothetical protein
MIRGVFQEDDNLRESGLLVIRQSKCDRLSIEGRHDVEFTARAIAAAEPGGVIGRSALARAG